MLRITAFILATLAIAALQVFLSTRPVKFYGLVLPGLSFFFSLLYVFRSAGVNEFSRVIVDVNGTMRGISNAYDLMFRFLFLNIPTIILLIIYLFGQQSARKNKEIVRMSIQDLQ